MTNMIHLVDGEKGGVGKSMLTRLLVEFNQKYDLLYTLIDGDFQNPDVQQRYPEYNAKVVALVEDEEKFFEIDIIFETAVTTPVIVNLPARVYGIINKWIDEANLHAGLWFDGRVAEDFKLSTGTFVSVGPLRAKVVAAANPLIADCAITGINEKEVGALVFP